MSNRLEKKTAIVVGAGQTPGETVGNGRAIALLFAREGAQVMLVDRRFESAQETQSIIEKEGGVSFAHRADITHTEDCDKIPDACLDAYGKIDILVNVVGVGGEAGGRMQLTEQQWDTIQKINIRAMMVLCKSVLPVMEKQENGSVITISSAAAVCDTNMLAYKVSKAGVNALTQYIAMRYAKKGIRANTIMPGLMNTPMAIEGISARLGISREELIDQRNSRVPLKGGMGDGWDTAYAALFLASDESKFITAVVLPVDGGQSARIG